MATIAFESLERQIIEHGEKSEVSVDLSELSLIGEGDDRAIGFSLLGANFLLTLEGEIVSVEGTDEDPELYALEGAMRDSVTKFLGWRFNFAKEFKI